MKKTAFKHFPLGPFFSLILIFPLAGCVPIATGVITYNAAVNHEENSGYADYFFAMEATNKLHLQAGQTTQPILSERQWLKDIYQPRLEYVEYYSWNIDRGNAPESLIPFENWNEAEYQKFKFNNKAEWEKAAEKRRNGK